MISIFFLAIIQGISEFLPISSSAHLIIFRDLFLIGKDLINENIALTFDVSLHFGTFLAILVYFFKDFLFNLKNYKIIISIIIATIPAAIIGFLFEDFIENVIRSKYLLIAFMLIIMGIIIYVIDLKKESNKTLDNITVKESLLIGLSQVFALFPGISRSGATITSARLLKINREDATKYSFYLSIPILLGAVLLRLFKIDFNILYENINIFVIGILVSFLTGLLSIRLLLGYIKNNNYKLFMWYRIIFGIIIIIFLIIHKY